jgi:hypothetical protein
VRDDRFARIRIRRPRTRVALAPLQSSRRTPHGPVAASRQGNGEIFHLQDGDVMAVPPLAEVRVQRVSQPIAEHVHRQYVNARNNPGNRTLWGYSLNCSRPRP